MISSTCSADTVLAAGVASYAAAGAYCPATVMPASAPAVLPNVRRSILFVTLSSFLEQRKMDKLIQTPMPGNHQVKWRHFEDTPLPACWFSGRLED
jgi:hypothetical protein